MQLKPAASIPSRNAAAMLLSAVMLSLAVAALSIAGCSAKATPASTKAPTTSGSTSMMAQQASAKSSKMPGMSTSSKDATGQVCAECAGDGKPCQVKGQATVENGVQVVAIALKGGYYTPNNFTVKANMPVRVTFSGAAKGCLAHPTFKSLGKKADVTTGSASLDLGTLKPGVYQFSCGMGVNIGSITVQ
jgi:hypothetical protein